MAIGYITDKDTGVPENYSIKMNYTTIDGYTPKNNKCFCSPYNYLVLTNNAGGRISFKPELFNSIENATNVTIYYNCVVCANPALFCYVGNYNGVTMYFDNPISYNNFPLVPYTYDVYSNWLALNKNSLNLNYIQKGTGMLQAATTGSVDGLVSSMFSFADTFAKQADMQNIPDSMTGTPQGNELLYSGAAGIFVNQETCKLEYIAKIDDYFTRYGYLINEVKKPLLHNRKNFDYIQTRDINIVGGVPAEDLEELCEIFNNGVTIWHNPETFGDYEVDNSTV